ncbi:unnamed protein product [Camellia sinensis]
MFSAGKADLDHYHFSLSLSLFFSWKTDLDHHQTLELVPIENLTKPFTITDLSSVSMHSPITAPSRYRLEQVAASLPSDAPKTLALV